MECDFNQRFCFYSEVLHEMNISYGNFYFFEGFVVSEIFEDVLFGWEEAKLVIYEVTNFMTLMVEISYIYQTELMIIQSSQ